jgi:hypothetical protein
VVCPCLRLDERARRTLIPFFAAKGLDLSREDRSKATGDPGAAFPGARAHECPDPWEGLHALAGCDHNVAALLARPTTDFLSHTPPSHLGALVRLPRDIPRDTRSVFADGHALEWPESAAGPCPLAPARPVLDQAALISIVVGVAARGAGTLTSSMPFAYVAFTWPASTPSGSATLRWKGPYTISRTK